MTRPEAAAAVIEAARALSEAHANIRTDTRERLDRLNSALAKYDALPLDPEPTT